MRRRLKLSDQKPAQTKEKPAKSDALVQRVATIDMQRDVFKLRLAGYDDEDIAEKLGITKHRVASLLTDAFEERKNVRDVYAERFLTTALARYEALLKTWQPLAHGFVEPVLDGNGQPVLDEDGNPRVRVYDPDPKAAKLVMEIMRDTRDALGLNKVRVEHTGANGGAIAVDIDWSNLTDEQLKKLADHPELATALKAFGGADSGAGAIGDSSPAATQEEPPPTTH